MTYRMICEFENSLAGHLGQVGTPAGGVIYRPGKFGQGVQIAEATTNLHPNPRCEGGTKWASNDGSVTFSYTTETTPYIGSRCAKFVRTTSTGTLQGSPTDIPISGVGAVPLTFTVYVKAGSLAAGQILRIRSYFYGGANAPAYGTTTVVGTTNDLSASEWKRYAYTITVDYADRTGVNFYFQILNQPIDAYFYLDAAQVEAKAYATPYCDGSLGAGHSWSGTAHASTSSRTGATLTYPAAVIDGEEGAVSMWVNHASNTGAGMGLFGSGADGQFEASTGATREITFNVNSTSLTTTATIAAGVWNHLAFTWSASQNKREIFINGVLAASRQYDSGFTLGATLLAFHRTAGAVTINGVGDQFVTVDRALTAAEVTKIYNGGAGLSYYDLLYALATPATFYVSGRFGADWVDISDYAKSLQWDLGFTGPYEVMARGETLNLALRNTDRRFSPENTAGAYYPNFTRNKDIKIDVLQDGVLHTLFYGQIDTIEPAGNIYGDRVTNVQCIGLLNRLQNIMLELEVQENKRADEVIAQILDNCNFAANVTGSWRLSISGYSELNSTAILGEAAEIYEAEPGETTFAVVGDDWGEDTSAYGAIRDVVGQEYGRFFVDRGGQFKFWSRHHFLKNTVSVMELADKHLAGLAYNYGADVINEVIVSARPRRVGSTNEVLAKLDTPQAVQVRPASTKSITFRYRDSDTGLEIGGKNAVVPQKALDWFANTLADGTGLDMLADMSATITAETGTSCTVEFANAHATQEAWIQPNAQIRGIKITGNAQTDSKARDSTSVTTYGLQRYKYPAALDQVSLAESMARFILSQRKDPVGLVKSITVAAHATPGRLAMVLDLPIGSRVTLTETQTGAAGDYFIIGESWNLQEKQITVQWQLAPANTSYWLLGSAGYAELNSTTILAPL